MDESYSISELAAAVNAWCEKHGVSPASGQAGEEVTERNIRFYRTIGLVEAPRAGNGRGFGEKHRLQLIAIRILQGQGLPLRKIRELLFGRSIAELREIQKRGLKEHHEQDEIRFAPATDELWRAIPLSAEFMIVSRRGATVGEMEKSAILSILHGAAKPQSSTKQSQKRESAKS